jgi:hypothetical protein
MSATSWSLPDNLQDAVDIGAISIAEASAIEDASLEYPELETVVLPLALWDAAQRLHLYEVPIDAVFH